jgi:formylglycine-generating enzyme required for sulfatase activity
MTEDTAPAADFQREAKVFISYSRKDMTFADRLEAALKARGFEVLIDRQEIYAFEDWWKRIEALIGQSDTVVFALSPDAVKSEVALREVAYAASLNKRFAPLVCRRVDDAAVPEALRRLNFIFFDDPTQFEASADKLGAALQTDIAWVRRHTEFGDTARRWMEAGRPGGMLLRPPVLDQAEAWLTFRPGGAPPPTGETEALIAQSRKAMLGSQRLRRFVVSSMFTLLVAIILGLVAWINQVYIADQWLWWTVTRPYAAAQVWPYILNLDKERALKPGDVFKECATDCPEMVIVPAGSFTMGSPPTEKGRGSNEGPQHLVKFAKPFAVSKYDLTFADWDACVTGGGCMGYMPNDQGGGRGRQPVMNVDWSDAQRYVAWLSQLTGKAYRLLSEAEYEYATRAGSQSMYPWGDNIKPKGKAMANCRICGNDYDHTAPVGSFPPNRFGLYDMLGNVWKWTEDCSHDDYDGAPADGTAWITGGECRDRINRGGAFTNREASDIRSAIRNWASYETRAPILGFRVARTLDRR